jgi:glycosyltransferase involved in cell wall biosynthesis
MNNQCIRILRIVAVMNRGGIESQIMNMYRKIDRSKYQFDFLVTRDEKGVFDEEIERMGGKIYRIPSVKKVGLYKFTKNIDTFFKDHKEYKVVHCHMNTWSGLFLNIAKRHEVPVRIAHSHSAQQGHKNLSRKALAENTLKMFMKKYINKGATHFWAVGHAAGEWLYGSEISKTKMKVLPNAKDLELYKYNPGQRESIRKELGISSDDTILLGHVGSFTPVKNHTFLINLFYYLRNEGINSKLCLVGEGPLTEDVKKQISSMGLSGKVFFMGLRNDVNELMSAFDVLILPSQFEGMPNVVIEAQSASLPCVISDNITKEVDMGMGLLKFISLSGPINLWLESIVNSKDIVRPVDSSNIRNRGYDINSQVKWLENFYKNSIK